MNLHAHGQFPFLSGSPLALLALFLLVLQGLGFLFELLAERDTVCWGGLAGAVCDGGEMQVRWTNECRTMNCPTKRADSAAAGPWPEEHGERCRVGDGEAKRGGIEPRESRRPADRGADSYLQRYSLLQLLYQSE